LSEATSPYPEPRRASRMIPVRFARDAVRGSDLSMSARYLLAVLAGYCQPTKICYPSDAELTDVTGMHRGTLWRARRELVDACLIAVEPGRGRGHRTRYLLLMPDLAPDIHNRRASATRTDVFVAQRDHNRRVARQKTSRQRDAEVTKEGTKEAARVAWCDATCELCVGAGWISEQHADGTWSSAPCPNRH
jgi:Helix-turn-helix domain